MWQGRPQRHGPQGAQPRKTFKQSSRQLVYFEVGNAYIPCSFRVYSCRELAAGRRGWNSARGSCLGPGATMELIPPPRIEFGGATTPQRAALPVGERGAEGRDHRPLPAPRSPSSPVPPQQPPTPHVWWTVLRSGQGWRLLLSAPHILTHKVRGTSLMKGGENMVGVRPQPQVTPPQGRHLGSALGITGCVPTCSQMKPGPAPFQTAPPPPTAAPQDCGQRG